MESYLLQTSGVGSWPTFPLQCRGLRSSIWVEGTRIVYWLSRFGIGCDLEFRHLNERVVTSVLRGRTISAGS